MSMAFISIMLLFPQKIHIVYCTNLNFSESLLLGWTETNFMCVVCILFVSNMEFKNILLSLLTKIQSRK